MLSRIFITTQRHSSIAGAGTATAVLISSLELGISSTTTVRAAAAMAGVTSRTAAAAAEEDLLYSSRPPRRRKNSCGSYGTTTLLFPANNNNINHHHHHSRTGAVLVMKRSFYQTGVVQDEVPGGELSAKEKKQQLKAKLKAAMAETQEKTETATADEKDVDDPKAKLKAKLEAKKNEQIAGDTTAADRNSSSSSSDVVTALSSSEASPTAAAGTVAPTSGPATPAATTTTAAEGAIKQYSYPELTADAAKHKAGLTDPTRPAYQNPLHHNNPDLEKMFEEDFDSKEEFEKAILPAPGLADADGNIPAPQNIQELADEMVHLTMLEYNELINKMADHFGFYEGQLGPDDDDGDGGDDDGDDEAAAAPAAAAKTAFDVKLVSFDANAKIKIIKEIRTIVPGLGLKEAKALVESAPVTLQKGMNQEAADEVKKKLVELGAVVEIE